MKQLIIFDDTVTGTGTANTALEIINRFSKIGANFIMFNRHEYNKLLEYIENIDIDEAILYLIGSLDVWGKCNEVVQKLKTYLYTYWEIPCLCPIGAGFEYGKLKKIHTATKFSKEFLQLNFPGVPIECDGVFSPLSTQVNEIGEKVFNVKNKINSKDMNYYCIGTVSERKNIQELYKAYVNEFTFMAWIKLYIHCLTFDGKYYHSLKELHFIKNNRLASKLNSSAYVSIDPCRSIEGIHKYNDVLLNLTRGEGLGLPAIEALLWGNIVVTSPVEYWVQKSIERNDVSIIKEDKGISVAYKKETLLGLFCEHDIQESIKPRGTFYNGVMVTDNYSVSRIRYILRFIHNYLIEHREQFSFEHYKKRNEFMNDVLKKANKKSNVLLSNFIKEENIDTSSSK